LCKDLEQKGVTIDFLIPEVHGSQTLWRRVFVDSSFLTSHVSKTKINSSRNYKKIKSIPVDSVTSIPARQYIGTSLKGLYDVAVITNPWIMEQPVTIDIAQKIMICYDATANKFALDNPGLFPWGFAHNTGYQYALREKVHFLSISPKIDKEMVDFYHPESHSALPAVLPPGFLNIPDLDVKKKNIVVLAAPFDPRKGLVDIPRYLNGLKDDIEAVHIFGRPRCGRKLYNQFLSELKVPFVHYIDITNDDLIQLYHSAKFLLFPSLEEGLGLPILEAQVCGCPVVTTNIPPMNQNVINGFGHILTGDEAIDLSKMKDLLTKPQEYNKLKTKAQERFSPDKIYQHFMKIIAMK